MGSAAAVLRATEEGPVHSVVGIVTPSESQALGYEHPLTVMMPGVVSCASNHPFPALIVDLLPGTVSVGGGSVEIGPVAVYVGTNAGSVAFPGRPEIDGGGYWLKDADIVGLIVPAPAPPVCHERYVPLNGFVFRPNDAQVPTATLGSGGIHPPCRPS